MSFKPHFHCKIDYYYYKLIHQNIETHCNKVTHAFKVRLPVLAEEVVEPSTSFSSQRTLIFIVADRFDHLKIVALQNQLQVSD